MTQDEIIEMANKAGNGDEEWLIIANQLFKHFSEEMQRFAKLVAEHEREECAIVCDEFPDAGHIGKRLTTNYHSYLIRNRG